MAIPMQRKPPLYFLLTSVTILLFSSLLHADTTWVAGEVYGTWTREGNPYLVTDTLTIPTGLTLDIQPGVEIWFQDQEIRRTPILVYGRLQAIGTERDSIYFYSPVTGFGGIVNDYTPGTEIRLEYCVIDSLYWGIISHYGLVVAKHSRLVACMYELMFCHYEIDTVQNCILQSPGGAHLEFQYGGPVVFRHNQGSTANFLTYNNQLAPVFDNHLNQLRIDGGSGAEIYDNDVGFLQLYEASANVHDCHIGASGFQAVTSSGFTFERNVVNPSITGFPVVNVIDYSHGIVRDNVIYGQARISNSSATFEGNLIVNQGYGIEIMLGGSNYIRGNTVVFNSTGIYCVGATGSHQIIDNIFMGDGVNCTGVYGSASAQFDIRYNDFYQVNSNTYNCELDTGNIFIDPRPCGGNPFDYHLQANSPCIDTGDPASPLDPDGTRADMGCYFFDHRIDNPPAIISPVVVNVQRGTTLRYEARATDDHGPLRFGFWNVPGWLHPVYPQIDFEDSTAVLSGRVPNQQQDFNFGVWVEDGAAQRDSQEVSVLVSPYTILAGEVTGVLTREQSPYMVVEDVVVPAGDSLRIEPGVEIRFQWEPVEDLRHRIVVRGKLNAIGTQEDTIRFLPEFGDSLLNAWRGISCVGSATDTSNFKYSRFLGGVYGIVVDSQALVTMRHSEIIDTRYGVHVSNASWAEVDSCLYQVFHPFFNTFFYAYSSAASIRNTNSEFMAPYQSGMHFDVNDGANVAIEGCYFRGSWGCRADHGSQLEFLRNKITATGNGIGYGNSASGILANNILSNGGGSGIYSADSVLVNNNVFFGTSVGVEFSSTPVNVTIRNNVFLANEIGVSMYHSYPPFTDISYNDLYGNDSDFVNCLSDSTNLYLNPTVQDTIDFRLSLGSPCIDAGDPDPFFNDVDSTRNDIGCWGGPWGESYPYTSVLSHQPKPIPTEFALRPPYPNPFNSVLAIPFTLPVEKEVIITIYNILGQKVQEFSFPPLSPGVHRVMWDATSCASGLYIIQLISGEHEFNQKALLLK
jgi:hypothetical protein